MTFSIIREKIRFLFCTSGQAKVVKDAPFRLVTTGDSAAHLPHEALIHPPEPEAEGLPHL